MFDSFLASDEIWHLLITTFATSLDPDQIRQSVGPGLDPKPLDSDSVPIFFFKVILYKSLKASEFWTS